MIIFISAIAACFAGLGISRWAQGVEERAKAGLDRHSIKAHERFIAAFKAGGSK